MPRLKFNRRTYRCKPRPVLLAVLAAAIAMLAFRAFTVLSDRMRLAAERVTKTNVSSFRGLFVVHCSYGLGNRLRAYSSAAALAEISNRMLLVVWQKDEHCNVSMADLFDVSSITVFEDDLRVLFQQQAMIANTVFYDAIESGKNDEIDLHKKQHIYVRTAFTLQARRNILTPAQYERLTKRKLQGLSPVQEVEEILDEMTAQVGSREYVSVHVRAVHDLREDVPSTDARFEAIHRNAIEPLLEHRRSCTVDSFIRALRRLPKYQYNPKVVLFTDSTPVRRRFKETLQGIVDVESDFVNSCGDKRGRACIQIALASMLFISQGTHFIGSHWSSFSEQAYMLHQGPWTFINGCEAVNSNFYSTLWNTIVVRKKIETRARLSS